MAPQAEKIEEHGGLFVVDPPTLRALVSEMQKLVITDGLADSVSLSLTVYFSDGFQQTFSDLEDVISLENPSWCSITGLFVVTEGQSATISCQLGPRRQEPRVRVVGSERQWVYESCRRIRNRLQSMSVWGPPMRIYGPRSACVSVVFVTSLGVLFTALLSHTTEVPIPIGFYVLFIALYLGVVYALLCHYLFYPLVFCIGHGARRHDTVIKWRWALGTVIVSTILIGGIVLPLIRRRWLGIS